MFTVRTPGFQTVEPVLINMSDFQRIINIFNDHIDTSSRSLEALAEPLLTASNMIVQALLSDNKIISCGNGISASISQQFCTLLLNRFEQERPSLPAISLNADSSVITAIAHDSSFNDIYAKQLRALGQNGDILLVFSAGGSENNIVQAVTAGRDRGMAVIICTGADGGAVSSLVTPDDLVFRVPARHESRIHEMHLLLIHALCELIDFNLFNPEV